jgi:hypothetical protein
MAILNYTTQIKVEKTAGEIQRKLAKAGACGIYHKYDTNGILVSISFQIKTDFGMSSFKLPANIEGVCRCLRKTRGVAKKFQTYEHASRVAWRILKDWIEAQIAIIESGCAELTEVFLPYALNQAGKTVYEAVKDDGMKMITYKEG